MLGPLWCPASTISVRENEILNVDIKNRIDVFPWCREGKKHQLNTLYSSKLWRESYHDSLILWYWSQVTLCCPGNKLRQVTQFSFRNQYRGGTFRIDYKVCVSEVRWPGTEGQTEGPQERNMKQCCNDVKWKLMEQCSEIQQPVQSDGWWGAEDHPHPT